MVRHKQRYDDAFAAVRHVVSKHDPEHLLEMGAPVDEYDPEVADLVRLVLRTEPPSGPEIVQTWRRWFGDHHRLREALADAVTHDLQFLHARFSRS